MDWQLIPASQAGKRFSAKDPRLPFVPLVQIEGLQSPQSNSLAFEVDLM